MPRHDWNKPSAHTSQPHHRRMKSGAKGKGHDHYIRAAKQEVSLARSIAWKAALERREKEREREDGTVGSQTVRGDKRRSVISTTSSARDARSAMLRL